MSRTRMFGTLAAVVAVAGFVAGCGGGGYTAAESAPTATTPAAAPAAAAAPAGPTAQGVIGSFAQSDTSSNDATFSSYTRFPKTRAGKIFVGPAPPPDPAATAAAAAAATPVAPAATNPVTTIPTTPTATPPATTTTAVATQRSASLDVSGVVRTVTVGGKIPPAAPQFTVLTISATGVTLKLNSGTLPGGGTTIDLLKGVPVTLSNPSTGTTLTINVLEIKTQV